MPRYRSFASPFPGPATSSLPPLTAVGNEVAVTIDGLWALRVGNGGMGGNPGLVYFTAGPDDESNGLFGSLSPTAVPEPAGWLLGGTHFWRSGWAGGWRGSSEIGRQLRGFNGAQKTRREPTLSAGPRRSDLTLY